MCEPQIAKGDMGLSTVMQGEKDKDHLSLMNRAVMFFDLLMVGAHRICVQPLMYQRDWEKGGILGRKKLSFEESSRRKVIPLETDPRLFSISKPMSVKQRKIIPPGIMVIMIRTRAELL
jgi:hypothetical protein